MIMRRITKIFLITKKKKKIYCIICGKYRKSKKTKISYLLQKTLVLLLFVVTARRKTKNYLKKKNQLRC